MSITIKRILFSGIVVIALAAVILAMLTPYTHLGHPDVRVKYYDTEKWPIYLIHIYLGAVAMLAGLLQFTPSIRNKYRQWHKRIGTVYLGCSLIGAVTAVYMSIYSEGGLAAHVGFAVGSLFWLFIIFNAILTVIKKDFNNHIRWVIRSYTALMLPVFFRVLYPIFIALGLSAEEANNLGAWLSWAPVMLMIEWTLIKHTYQKNNWEEAL